MALPGSPPLIDPRKNEVKIDEYKDVNSNATTWYNPKTWF